MHWRLGSALPGLVFAIAGIAFASLLGSATPGRVFGLSAMMVPAIGATMLVPALIGLVVRNRRARRHGGASGQAS